MSLLKSLQCGQSAIHDGMFPYFPAMFIAVMAIRNIKLRTSSDIAENRLKMAQ